MPYALDMKERVSVTLTVEDWAEVAAAVGLAHVPLMLKERVNSTIFQCVGNGKRASS